VNCHASSCLPTNPFVEQWVGIEPPTLWLLDDHTYQCATANPNTNVKMYEKNTHTNIWKRHACKYMTKTHTKSHTNVWQKHAYRHAYKCMTKTRIQMYEKNRHTNIWQKHAYKIAYKCMTKTRIQMYDKNRHTNVWQKPAYKCMKKTCIQMYDKNMHTKVWQKHAHKCMKKTCIQMYDKNMHTKVWQKPAYKCMTKTRIQMYEKNMHTNVWQKHAHKCRKKIYSNTGAVDSHLQRPGSMGVQCLSQGHLSRDKEVNCHASSCLPTGTSAVTRRWTATPPAVYPPILLLSSEWGLNSQLSGYWTTTLTTAPRPTQIQM